MSCLTHTRNHTASYGPHQQLARCTKFSLYVMIASYLSWCVAHQKGNDVVVISSEFIRLALQNQHPDDIIMTSDITFGVETRVDLSATDINRKFICKSARTELAQRRALPVLPSARHEAGFLSNRPGGRPAYLRARWRARVVDRLLSLLCCRGRVLQSRGSKEVAPIKIDAVEHCQQQ